MELTRELLKVLLEFKHPLSIVTKSTLIERDLDIIKQLSKHNLIKVMISITCSNNDIKQSLEPRAASPSARLKIIRRLSENKIPVGVLIAPVIPFITDHEMESLLENARDAGASTAGYILLRLPYEVKGLFREWLANHFPDKAKHVMSLIQQSRGGKDYCADYGQRMTGSGEYASLLASRFKLACKRLNLNKSSSHSLNTQLFTGGQKGSNQLSFDL